MLFAAAKELQGLIKKSCGKNQIWKNKTHFHTQGQKVKQTRDLKLRAAFSRLLTKHQVSTYIHCLRDPFKDQSKPKSSYTLNAGNSK